MEGSGWKPGGRVVESWLAAGVSLNLSGGICTDVHDLPLSRRECRPASSAPAPALPCVRGPDSLESEPHEVEQAEGLFQL